MTIYNFFGKKVFLPLSDFITNQRVSKNFSFLNKSQFWSREEIDQYQDQKLRELIHHVYENVPYYKELFIKLNLKPEDIQSKRDLHKLPIITKGEIKDNADKFFAKNINKKDLIFASSSGSTGEPIQFYKTKQSESLLKAALLVAWSWMGYKIGDKYVKLSMNPRNSFLKKMQDKMNNCLYLSSTQISSNDFKKIAEKTLKFDPLFIRGYPVPLKVLADQIKESGEVYKGKSLIAINTTGSTLSDSNRKEIESVFNVKVFDAYSCEGGTVFSQCPDKINYHPIEEYAISEYIEDNYSKTDAEKPLRHITTDLHNYAFPFIRYDTQDYIVLGDSQRCSCGRNYQNIKSIKGRDSDILITPSGKFLIVENFVAYFEWIPEVDQIQVIQNKIDEIVIKLLVNSSFNSDVKQKIINYWEDYIGNDVNLIVEVVDEIKLTPTGKRRTVIRNPEISLNV
jgi:phenylacetate-CoA ligase